MGKHPLYRDECGVCEQEIVEWTPGAVILSWIYEWLTGVVVAKRDITHSVERRETQSINKCIGWAINH